MDSRSLKRRIKPTPDCLIQEPPTVFLQQRVQASVAAQFENQLRSLYIHRDRPDKLDQVGMLTDI